MVTRFRTMLVAMKSACGRVHSDHWGFEIRTTMRPSVIRRLSITASLFMPFFGCHSSKPVIHSQGRQETADSDRLVADLRSLYRPFTDWPHEMDGRTFTIDVKPIFVRDDHRPVLFYALLEDIKGGENGQVLLYLMMFRKGRV